MPPDKHIIVHVGIHKTGTTAIQEFLGEHRARLREHGVEFFRGQYLDNEHRELHVACMRPERLTPFKIDRDLTADEGLCMQVRARIRRAIDRTPAACILFSCEWLSCLRYEDEIVRLKELFPDLPITIIMVVRKPEKFLPSYRRMLDEVTKPPTIDKDSYAYTGDDTWLIDFDSRLALLRQVFGDDHVIKVDYDGEVAQHHNIIPSFLRLIGMQNTFSALDWEYCFHNVTRRSNNAWGRLSYSIAKRKRHFLRWLKAAQMARRGQPGQSPK